MWLLLLELALLNVLLVRRIGIPVHCSEFDGRSGMNHETLVCN